MGLRRSQPQTTSTLQRGYLPNPRRERVYPPASLFGTLDQRPPHRIARITVATAQRRRFAPMSDQEDSG
jgi:hypothetical protein